MRRVHAIAALALTSSLALLQSACLLTGKPKTPTTAVAPPQPKPVAAKPAAPSEALSVPQTQVHLPPPQPLESGGGRPANAQARSGRGPSRSLAAGSQDRAAATAT